MTLTPSRSVCLAMIVKNEAAIIERCLSSVRNYIDTWVIVDTGSDDDGERRAKRILDGVPGKWISKPWYDFSSNRNELLEICHRRADYILLMDADETFKTTESNPWSGLDHPAYNIEVKSPRHSMTPIRLIRDNEDYRYSGVVAEVLTGPGQSQYFENVAIVHHEDGVRHRDPFRARRDILDLDNALLKNPTDPVATLALADRFTHCGDRVSALYHYRQRARMDGDTAESWYAHYRIARILDDLGYATHNVVEAYQAAYYLRTGKIEPLIHIIRRSRRVGNFTTAVELAEVTLDTDLHDRDYYFEPEAYHHFRYIEYLRSKLELNHYDEVVETAERLCGNDSLPSPVMKEIEDIRQCALDHRVLRPELRPLSVLPKASTTKSQTIATATPLRSKKKLCIGMSTYDDYDGVYFSVQAIRLYHSEVLDQLEILVIDNNPAGPAASSLKALDTVIDNYRYIPQAEAVGCIARDYIFREANADYVLVMDCHVLLMTGVLKRLIAYYDANPESNDLLQGPLIYDDLKSISTHFDPKWQGGMYGVWGSDSRGKTSEGEPFDIEMQGCGVFSCRKEAWPGFNNRFRGFGAEEGYIHEKFRQAGGRTLCLPFLRWMHRFARPLGVPYEVKWNDRIRNYMIGWQELGLDLAPIQAHFSDHLGVSETEEVVTRVAQEMASPLFAFDGVFHLREQSDSRLDGKTLRHFLVELNIADRVVNIDTPNQDLESNVGRLLACRAIINQAEKARLKTVLIIQSIEDIIRENQQKLADSVKLLNRGDIDSFILSANGHQSNSTAVAMSLHRRLFERLIERLPDSPNSAATWLTANGSLENYLERMLTERR